MNGYRAPRWLGGAGVIGGNAQTIWSALGAQLNDPATSTASTATAAAPYRRERWPTPDGDFIDVDWQEAPNDAPLLVLFHGLEGSSRSHYALAFAHCARRLGWRYAVPHFRGCSGSLNLAPRAYHSGDFEEIGWMLERCAAAHAGPLVAVGISLGGNALLRWAEEAGDAAAARVRAVCAVSAPLDLAASGMAIGRGFNRLVYTRHFLRTMRRKALLKLQQHPGLFDLQRLRNARDLYAFDDVFTAPLHGFRDTDDYWARASARAHLRRIRVPALIVNARNDPFVPAASLPWPGDVVPPITLWQPAAGGHVGFPAGVFPGHVQALPSAAMAWLSQHLVQ